MRKYNNVKIKYNNNKMFRYSLVYAVKDMHPLCHVIKRYANALNTVTFCPHITIKHSLSFENALSLHRLFCSQYDLPNINFMPEVSNCSSILYNANGKRVMFYSLEQPVLINGVRVSGMHVSLAYKINSPFTIAERDMVRPWDGVLNEEDIELTVYSCHAKNPKFWRYVL